MKSTCLPISGTDQFFHKAPSSIKQRAPIEKTLLVLVYFYSKTGKYSTR